MTEQPDLFNDERNNTAHSSPNETISGSISESSRIGGSTIMNQPYLQGYEQSNYVNANSLHVNPLTMYDQNTQMAYGHFPSMLIPNSPTMFGGQPFPAVAYEQFPSMLIPNSPTMFHGQPFPADAYGQFPSTLIPHSPTMFGGQPFPAVAYGQFPSMLIPHSPTMFGGQPFPAVAYGQFPSMLIPNSPTMFGGQPFPAAAYGQFPSTPSPNSPTMFGGGPSLSSSGTGYDAPHGSFVGSSEQVPNSLESMRYLSPVASWSFYQQPMGGIRRPYEESVMQQAPPMQGIGYASNTSATQYPNVGSDGVSQYGGSSYTQFDSNQQNRLNVDKERDSISYPSEWIGSSSDRNRGPRASKSKNNKTIPALQIAECNRPDFCVEYENAKFYVIKSISEDKVHNSIKYGIWSSTVSGNRKLNDAYRQAKTTAVSCPVFLFFSVKLELGIQMMKIFKEYKCGSSLLDDFNFNDDQEMAADDDINQLSENLDDILHLETSKTPSHD